MKRKSHENGVDDMDQINDEEEQGKGEEESTGIDFETDTLIRKTGVINGNSNDESHTYKEVKERQTSLFPLFMRYSVLVVFFLCFFLFLSLYFNEVFHATLNRGLQIHMLHKERNENQSQAYPSLIRHHPFSISNSTITDAETIETIEGKEKREIAKETPVTLHYFDASLIIPAVADSISLSLNLLNSLLHQTVYPREVVVVVSKATNPNNPAYLEVKRKWQSSLSGPSPYHGNHNLNIQLKWIEVEGRLLAHQARNRGASEASSAYLCPFDVDDIMHPRRIEIISKVFEVDEPIDFILHDYVYVQRKEIEQHHKHDYTTHYMGDVLDRYNLNLQPQKVDDPYSFYPSSLYTNPMKKKFNQIFPPGTSPVRKANNDQNTIRAVPYFPSQLTIHLNRGESVALEKNYGAKDLLSYANGWPSMRRSVWESHPQCEKRTDKECHGKEDSLQTKDVLADNKFQVVIVPLKLGIYAHR